jgi:hypothetical protein
VGGYGTHALTVDGAERVCGGDDSLVGEVDRDNAVTGEGKLTLDNLGVSLELISNSDVRSEGSEESSKFSSAAMSQGPEPRPPWFPEARPYPLPFP